MKIAFLHMWMGTVDRGSEISVSDLASRLSIKNEVVIFQAGKDKGDKKYKIKTIPMNIDWDKKSSSGTFREKLLVDYWALKVMVFTIKSIPTILKERFDVVIPVNGAWMSFIVRFITFLYGGKMVITGRAGIGWDDQTNLRSFPDIFVALSSAAKKWAKGVNPNVRVIYIPNGIDVSKFSPNGSQQAINLRKPIVLCVSALAPAKRVDLVIKAVSKLEKVSLLVVGKGELKPEILKLGKDLLGDRFKLISVPFEKMPNIYRTCDVCTNASIPQISFERVLVEAMASGLPVIANNDEIRKEIVGKAGYLVNPLNSDEYASFLRKALYKKWGNLPIKQAAKFTLDKTAKSYEDLFTDLLK